MPWTAAAKFWIPYIILFALFLLGASAWDGHVFSIMPVVMFGIIYLVIRALWRS